MVGSLPILFELWVLVVVGVSFKTACRSPQSRRCCVSPSPSPQPPERFFFFSGVVVGVSCKDACPSPQSRRCCVSVSISSTSRVFFFLFCGCVCGVMVSVCFKLILLLLNLTSVVSPSPSSQPPFFFGLVLLWCVSVSN